MRDGTAAMRVRVPLHSLYSHRLYHAKPVKAERAPATAANGRFLESLDAIVAVQVSSVGTPVAAVSSEHGVASSTGVAACAVT